MINTLLLVAILLHQVWAIHSARRERRRIELAALARTPAEFAHLLQSAQSGKLEA